ncbi:hypothetical protein I547_3400 [Mycobacterium kansasii 824]|uniref:Uncharacterized protein n=1 Tax=Mycobacterium kansasii TaxID=1768 RepID=A0A1V3XMR3_MYCKA|nr:hypothetical protein I547_3400 [Mycobacterium kansasii 824]OOK79100.1 hypothetical protein BZL30_2790 [Mycobacterium kansasii]OOK80398.1 hypothetical protein BZL29_2732 [Mycobacterium kansasii]
MAAAAASSTTPCRPVPRNEMQGHLSRTRSELRLTGNRPANSLS